jgi:membrane associated rhomboid family serine protease
MGAAVAAQRARGINPFDSGIGGLLVINLVFTFAVPGISIGGHIGGLIGGAVAGWVLIDAGPKLSRNPAVALVACAVLAAGVGAANLWAAPTFI